MSNYNLYKDRPFDKKWYKLYLRSESLKKLIDPNYKTDKSIDGYLSSKFYRVGESMSYSQYLAENLDKNIVYSEYISESVNKSIDYSEYLASQISITTSSNPIIYTQYI